MDLYNTLMDLNEVREVREHRNRLPRVHHHRVRVDPFLLYTEREFRNRYRLSKNCVRHVLDLVGDRLGEKLHGNDVGPSLKLLVALRYYTKGCYQTELGDLHGLSQPTVSRIVTEVPDIFAELLDRFVKFPERIDALQVDFYGLARFPRVVGCIDCTHVRIKCLDRERAQLYINRKGFYLLNVQVVCDARRRILDIVARWRGSTHDARIWSFCNLKDRFEAGAIGRVLLGDSGYPLTQYLLTPYLNPRIVPEENFNAAHILTRNVVKRCFREWKGMFRALQNGLQISLPHVRTAIVAMAVLFNIQKEFGEDGEYDAELDEVFEDDPVEPGEQQAQADGRRARDVFTRRFFT